MRELKTIFFLLIFSAIFSAALQAQNKKEDNEVLRIETQLIEVPVEITDKSGKPILDLKQSNFVVFEDGQQQTLADFAATTVPFEVALLLDTSGSTRSELPLITRAAENFINSLRVGDKVSIIGFNTVRAGGRATAVSEVLTDLTDDRNKLKAVLRTASVSNGTPYYDSLLQVIERVFANPPEQQFRGRRALVALTDGVDSTSLSGFDEARELFGQAGIVSYFIQIDTREFFEENLLGDCQSATHFSNAQIRRYYRVFYPKSKIEKVSGFCQLGDFERLDISKRLYELADAEMQHLAKTSGGKVFPVRDLTEARTAFAKVALEIGTKYSLGYYSSNEKRDGTYRKIKIELKGIPDGAVVRAREGYTALAN